MVVDVTIYLYCWGIATMVSCAHSVPGITAPPHIFFTSPLLATAVLSNDALRAHLLIIQFVPIIVLDMRFTWSVIIYVITVPRNPRYLAALCMMIAIRLYSAIYLAMSQPSIVSSLPAFMLFSYVNYAAFVTLRTPLPISG